MLMSIECSFSTSVEVETTLCLTAPPIEDFFENVVVSLREEARRIFLAASIRLANRIEVRVVRCAQPALICDVSHVNTVPRSAP